MSNFSAVFDDIWLLGGARTPWVDYCGSLADVSPIDLGIKAARAALARSGVDGSDVDSVVTGSMAQASFDAYMLPRHIGLYAGVPIEVPALMAQRICGSGFELIRQAADQLTLGYANVALAVGTESMSRNPICAYTHRSGFRLGAPVEFKDFLWEALDDPAARVSMIQTAENLARRHGIAREDVDAYAARSFARALRAQTEGFFEGEIVPVVAETFSLAGYESRGIRLPRRAASADRDTHPRPSPIEALAGLRPVYDGGVQTAGNSAALVDGAAAVVVATGAETRRRGLAPLARLRAAAVAGVPPEIMGIGPVPAIRGLLARCGLRLADIDLFEINEAQGAQVLACARELGLDQERLNVNGGSIALGHPLAATGVRLTLTAARELQRRGGRFAVVSACVGGGQGMALLIENGAMAGP
ncbi:thiolase family protein [Roseateles sp. MS654]|uniref:thiolase family protein n=1 Tax=Roseateles sp. MS654 TaxID=3412685 RepID=UPI003C30DFC1